MQEFCVKKLCSDQAAQQPTYSCLHLNHSSHAGVPHPVVFQDRMSSVLRNLFEACKKGMCFIFACENEVLPLLIIWTRSSHLLGLLSTTCVKHGNAFLPALLDTWRAVLLLHLIESKWDWLKVQNCMHNSYFLFYLCALFRFCRVFSAKGLWY